MLKKTVTFILITALTISCNICTYAKSQSFNTSGNIEKNSDIDNAVCKVVLSAGEVKNNIKENYLEKDAVKIHNENSAQWDFEIKDKGFYNLKIIYAQTVCRKNADYKVKINIDGKSPFNEKTSIFLPRAWEDDGFIKRDSSGNDINPPVKEKLLWQKIYVTEDKNFSEYCKFYFDEGRHTLTLSADMPLYINALELLPSNNIPSYNSIYEEYKAKGYKFKNNVFFTYQAEKTYLKSSEFIVPVSDGDSAATVPNSPYEVRNNIIGGESWSNRGESISYKIDVPYDGFYCLTFKYRQNKLKDKNVYRKITVNGEVPFSELDNVEFKYSRSWSNLTLGDAEGHYNIPLKKGENIISLTVTEKENSASAEKNYSPLELDYFVLHGKDARLVPANGKFSERLGFAIKKFIVTFAKQYYFFK